VPCDASETDAISKENDKTGRGKIAGISERQTKRERKEKRCPKKKKAAGRKEIKAGRGA